MEEYASGLREATFRQSNNSILEVSESRDEKQRALKKEYGSVLASSFRKLATLRHTFDTIERRLTKPVRQSIVVELTKMATILKEARAVLGKDVLEQMPTQVRRIEAGFGELKRVFQPHIDRLQYEVPNGPLASRHGDHQLENHHH